MLPTEPVWELALRAVLIYTGLLIALRVFGKRQVGQFTLFDLVFVLLVANALQPSITGPDNTLGGGFVLIVAFALINFALSKASQHWPLKRLLIPEPTVVLRNGRPIEHVMSREGVEMEEIEASMRDHGIDDIKQVKLAVLEPDGRISVVPKSSSDPPDEKGRRVRHRRSRSS